ncbi:unnamed protein product [Musa acuminata subsp. malaccensis]|uniref:(wild Malaysian banana) hypothetical protein n=1 Tax=Musa acuminata subsp. malaccensis TaxID=214687 RepID=A0A804J7Y4_MUSAM|nr:unnamed protein product [Musa acuminata subsp. malaccensis]
MGTEVLRPHDCLLCPSLALRNSKPIRRRRDSSLKRSAKPRHPAPGGGHLVVGQVAILRRGESLEAEKATKGEPVAGSGGWGPAVFVTGRLGLGPNPGMIPREVPLLVPAAEEAAAGLPDEVYAGSGFVLSPSPRALPLPTFSRKKEGSVAAAVVDCSATRDLRRLLRLD